jgi:hypothetical protein
MKRQQEESNAQLDSQYTVLKKDFLDGVKEGVRAGGEDRFFKTVVGMMASKQTVKLAID